MSPSKVMSRPCRKPRLWIRLNPLFPTTMDSFTIYYALSVPNQSRAVLRIPVEDALRYSTRPLKWIRYVTGAVLGMEGALQRHTKDRDQLNNNTIDLEDASPPFRQLLFVPNAPIRYIDQYGLNHLPSSKFTTESIARFRAALEERDEDRCIITGSPGTICDAFHLIPHSKGDQYIQRLCQWRKIYDDEEITSIDDVRNGLLVDLVFGRLHSLGYAAVLRTPNFALAVDEVLPNPSEHNPTFRFTPHYFLPSKLASQGDRIKQDLRHPANLVDGWPEEWPPIFLWDFVYGVVISRVYGIRTAGDILTEEVSQHYYPQGVQTATAQALADLTRSKQRREKQINERRNEASNTAAQNYSDALDTVYSYWMCHYFGPLGQKARAQEEADFQNLKQEFHKLTMAKVTQWREGMKECINSD